MKRLIVGAVAVGMMMGSFFAPAKVSAEMSQAEVLAVLEVGAIVYALWPTISPDQIELGKNLDKVIIFNTTPWDTRVWKGKNGFQVCFLSEIVERQTSFFGYERIYNYANSVIKEKTTEFRYLRNVRQANGVKLLAGVGIENHKLVEESVNIFPKKRNTIGSKKNCIFLLSFEKKGDIFDPFVEINYKKGLSVTAGVHIEFL